MLPASDVTFEVGVCRYFSGRCDHFVDYGTWAGDGRPGCREAVNSLPGQGHKGMSMLSVDLNQDEEDVEAETDADTTADVGVGNTASGGAEASD